MSSQMMKIVGAGLGMVILLYLVSMAVQENGNGGSDVIKATHVDVRSASGDACAVGGYERPQLPRTVSRGKRVLVTGVAGFIGSHVAHYCAETLGMHVVGVDDLSGGFTENVIGKVKFVQADVKDAHAMSRVFREEGPFDYVYHIAAYAAEGLSHFIRSYNYRNNLVGSVEVLNLAIKHNVSCFVFTSSIAVYGAAKPPIKESTKPDPEDPYGVSKYAMEMDLKAAKEMYGMDYVIFRPHNVYGPHQNIADKYRNVVGIFMNNILNGKPLGIFGDGTQTRAFSYIDDVAPVIAQGPLVPEARNEVFNVGTDHPSSLLELAREVRDVMGASDTEIKHFQKRLEVHQAEATHEKMRCYFNPPVPTTLRNGLIKTAEWVRKLTKGYKPVEFKSVEILRKLPALWSRPDLTEEDAISHTADDNTRGK
eukprot:PhM_4_TR2691/c0_g1_i2/m.19267/K01784/galE, GALE; UDP-glucose 4-epimerase